ncbi:MAG TPA: BON domain-containing protein [Gammaproteobacteria bacterium]|nr:BON domain-containing protein [Gammaproteobacteria bacterium]
MKGFGWRALFLASTLSLLAACGALVVSGRAPVGATDGSAAGNGQDARIASDINRLLVRDPAISAFDVRVLVHAGRVRLSGRVPSERALQRAMRLARSVKGVHSVESSLVVAH